MAERLMSAVSEAGLSLETESGSDFFYSESLGKYVGLNFLKVDERVVKAASELDLKLDWDEEGRVCNVTFVDARRLLDRLGSSLLAPREFWLAFQEARVSDHAEAISSFQSDEGAEWLDIVFLKDSATGQVMSFEHPPFSAHGLDFSSSSYVVNQPIGRPGWFAPYENIDCKTGLPLQISTRREKGTPAWSQTTWKYWSTFQTETPVAGIRGYVTSSGTPSLDLDIPINACQPVLMIRECRDQLPSPDLDPKISSAFSEIESFYLSTLATTPGVQNDESLASFYEHRHLVIDFMKHYPDVSSSQSRSALHIKERIFDLLGQIHLFALRRQDQNTLDQIRLVKESFSFSEKAGTYPDLSAFINSSRDRLGRAMAENRRIVFVMGHKNPDTDTAVSALFEAYRKSLLDPETAYIPVIQSARIPDEIARLLGNEFSNSFILTAEDFYLRAEKLGQTRWVLVDHNKSDKQRFALSVIDHHILSFVAKNQEIPKTWEMIGSCSAQVAMKLYGMGIILDSASARILHGATLMDTENRGPKKMTPRDKLIMDHLKLLSKENDEDTFYQDLMSHLLNTDDPERLFNRDYKEDWGIFGFAVAKVKNVFDADGASLKPEVLQGLVENARLNNEAKHFCMTLIKVVDYQEDNQTVNREKIFLVFNDYAPSEFRQIMGDALEHIIKVEFQGRSQIRREPESIEFWGVGDQLSRKVTAPEFEALVAAFNEYYFSPATELYVRRDFLKLTPEVKRVADELGISVYADSEGRLCNITYHEAKQLIKYLGFQTLSLPEYWRIFNEVNALHDVQMQRHLRSRGFVEFLDTVILDQKEVINHPEINFRPQGPEYSGETVPTTIPTALPALIYPSEIDPDTGFPRLVHQGQEKYADPATWRYWSPDAKVAIPTRGYIFLLDKPALDSKIHPDDALPNLGIRVVAKQVVYPKVIFDSKEGEPKIRIVSGDKED